MSKYQEALDNLVKVSCSKKVRCIECDINKTCNCMAKEYVDTLQKLVDKATWIPIEEREQKKSGTYLVTYHPCYWGQVNKDVVVGIDTFRGKTSWAKNKYQNVIAWMPLPEPYLRSDEDETL